MCEQKTPQRDLNKGLSYRRWLEVELQTDIGNTKGKLCSAQGHIFKWLLLKHTARVYIYSCYIIMLGFFFPLLLISLRRSPEHEQIESLTADVHKRYPGDIRVNSVSFHRRAVSQTIIIKVVCVLKLLRER